MWPCQMPHPMPHRMWHPHGTGKFGPGQGIASSLGRILLKMYNLIDALRPGDNMPYNHCDTHSGQIVPPNITRDHPGWSRTRQKGASRGNSTRAPRVRSVVLLRRRLAVTALVGYKPPAHPETHISCNYGCGSFAEQTTHAAVGCSPLPKFTFTACFAFAVHRPPRRQCCAIGRRTTLGRRRGPGFLKQELPVLGPSSVVRRPVVRHVIRHVVHRVDPRVVPNVVLPMRSPRSPPCSPPSRPPRSPHVVP